MRTLRLAQQGFVNFLKEGTFYTTLPRFFQFAVYIGLSWVAMACLSFVGYQFNYLECLGIVGVGGMVTCLLNALFD